MSRFYTPLTFSSLDCKVNFVPYKGAIVVSKPYTNFLLPFLFFFSELEMVNAWLVSNPGPFLCGRELSIHDCSLVPKLYHLRVAGKHYRQFSIPERLHALHGYYGRVVSLAPFTETAYGSDEIIHGWSRFFV